MPLACRKSLLEPVMEADLLEMQCAVLAALREVTGALLLCTQSAFVLCFTLLCTSGFAHNAWQSAQVHLLQA